MSVVKQVMALPLLLTTIVDALGAGPSAWRGRDYGCARWLHRCWVLLWLSHIERLARTRVVAVLILLLGAIYIYRSERAAAAVRSEGQWQPYSEARLASLKGRDISRQYDRGLVFDLQGERTLGF